MKCILKKTISICLVGLGIGILLVLFLPLSGWLFLIGSTIILAGLICLFN